MNNNLVLRVVVSLNSFLSRLERFGILERSKFAGLLLGCTNVDHEMIVANLLESRSVNNASYSECRWDTDGSRKNGDKVVSEVSTERVLSL